MTTIVSTQAVIHTIDVAGHRLTVSEVLQLDRVEPLWDELLDAFDVLGRIRCPGLTMTKERNAPAPQGATFQPLMAGQWTEKDPRTGEIRVHEEYDGVADLQFLASRKSDGVLVVLTYANEDTSCARGADWAQSWRDATELAETRPLIVLATP